MRHHPSELSLSAWPRQRWPDFTPADIACRCCGEVFVDAAALDALQALQRRLAVRLTITSGHRCALHNARVGGAPLSRHKRLAFDIALGGHDLAALLVAARQAGFTGFGFGQSFLHLDTRPRPAQWFYGQRSKQRWTSVLCSTAASAAGCSDCSAMSPAK